MEQKLIQSIIQSRDAWEEILSLVNPEDQFTAETRFIFDSVGEYYTLDPDAKFVDRELLCSQIKRNISSEKRANRIIGVVQSVPTETVSAINVVKELTDLKRSNLAIKLAGMLAQGDQDPEQIVKMMDEYKSLDFGKSGGIEGVEALSGVNVKDLVQEHFDGKNLIKLWPKVLNDQCDGGAKPGHHILVFAPTEMGKTLFVINLVYGFIRQGLRVLYIGNEDPAADIYMRYVSRVSGRNKFEVIKDPDGTQKVLEEKNYGLLTLVPLAPGNFTQINKLVDKYEPAVVVLDQLRNLDVRSEGRTQQLEKAATEARNLAKSKAILVVSVTQAGDSASGKRVLSRGDVDSSNVGIPGQVDLMLGLGATEDEEKRNVRVISLPKNKLSGKHEHIVVSIDPTTSRVVE